jgi:hypothetical protein
MGKKKKFSMDFVILEFVRQKNFKICEVKVWQRSFQVRKISSDA